MHAATFSEPDLARLRDRFELIEITDAECQALATNVVVVDPETVVLDPRQQRIAAQLGRRGYRTVTVDYSEPIALSGSFRCATMPLVRTP